MHHKVSSKNMSQQQMLDYYKQMKDDEVTRNIKGSVEKDEQKKDETNQSLAQDTMELKVNGQGTDSIRCDKDLIDLPLLDQMKVIFLGNSGTGKSSLLNRFTTGKFHPQKVTIGQVIAEEQIKNVGVGPGRVELCIWDTAGSERFRTTTLLPMYYRRARGAIVVYDITNKQSFVDIEEKWMFEMSSHCSKIPSILLGNKFDLKSDRKVSIAEGKALAQKYGMLFMETSAKNRSIEYAMAELVIEMMNKPGDRPDLGKTIKPKGSSTKIPKNKKCC